MLRNHEKDVEALQKIAFYSDNMSAEEMRALAKETVKANSYVDGKKMAEMLSDYVNSSGRDDLTAFAETVTRQHRTLQQGCFRHFIACIQQWAKAAREGFFDLRNEDTVKASQSIVDKIGEDTLRTAYV